MAGYSDEEFEKKLRLLEDTNSSIKSLSEWCMKRHSHENIVSIWLKVIKEVEEKQRLNMFYLANDIIQCGKKKNYKFIDTWTTAIQKAIPHVR